MGFLRPIHETWAILPDPVSGDCGLESIALCSAVRDILYHKNGGNHV